MASTGSTGCGRGTRRPGNGCGSTGGSSCPSTTPPCAWCGCTCSTCCRPCRPTGRPRRRRPRARAARRGLPRPRLLGRAVRAAAAQPAAARGRPRPCCATGRGGCRRRDGRPQRGRPRRGDVPLAVRQRRPRGDPAAAPQPAAPVAGCRTRRTPAAHRHRRRVQRLAVLPGHRRPPVPAPHGAEMLLEVARFLADLAEYDPATGRYAIRGVVGPGRVPHRLPRRPADRHRQQRLHQRDGGMGAAAGAGRPGAAARPTGARSWWRRWADPRTRSSDGATSRAGWACRSTPTG